MAGSVEWVLALGDPLSGTAGPNPMAGRRSRVEYGPSPLVSRGGRIDPRGFSLSFHQEDEAAVGRLLAVVLLDPGRRQAVDRVVDPGDDSPAAVATIPAAGIQPGSRRILRGQQGQPVSFVGEDPRPGQDSSV